ncbi:MAG: hypothetical protein M0R17_02725 [Candidatus Omnitrophica bacterium]|jgi:hypothetical protein|nr:hypothetical protein [Candidatus Omnitrophota bacterium]
MSKIIFVSDYFSNEVRRGAEVTNDVLLYYLGIANTIESHKLNIIDINSFYIITNFVNLNENTKQQLIKYKNYLIYEHDHKYISTRNPFLLPTGEVNISGIVPEIYFTNRAFYNNAKVVICQTQWHEDQLNKNNITNTTNIHGSLYLHEDLELINSIRLNTLKIDKYAFFNDAEFITLSNGMTLRQGQNIKNKQGSLRYCLDNKLPYFPIPRINVKENFWKTLAKFKHFIFFPDIPETCSRLLIEAKMLDINVTTNQNSGAYHEPWFQLSGIELIDKFKDEIIPNAINLFKGYI